MAVSAFPMLPRSTALSLLDVLVPEDLPVLTEGHGGRHAWLDLQPLGTQTSQPHPPTHPPTYVPSVCRAVALCMAAEPAYCLAMASPCSLYIASSKGHTTSNCWLLNGKPTCLCMAHIRVCERVADTGCGQASTPQRRHTATPTRTSTALGVPPCQSRTGRYWCGLGSPRSWCATRRLGGCGQLHTRHGQVSRAACRRVEAPRRRCRRASS